MTIKVSITKDEDGNGDEVHVAVLARDAHGNPTGEAISVTRLETGETREFYVHGQQELSVYETTKTQDFEG